MSANVTRSIPVALIGATGYAGQELVRLLARHPQARLTGAFGSASMEAPRKLHALTRIWDGEVVAYAAEALDPSVEAVFLALPEASAAETRAGAARARRSRHRSVGRLPTRDDAAARQRWYPTTTELPDGTVYGLAEAESGRRLPPRA